MNGVIQKETQRLRQQTLYDDSRPSGDRNRRGQYSTPFALAAEIVEFVVSLTDPDVPLRVLEPAVGTGAFFSALLHSVPIERIHSAVSFERYSELAETAVRLWADSGLEVIHGDFTSLYESLPTYGHNLVVTNPPYVRHHHLSRTTKERLRKEVVSSTGHTVSGLAGLYTYFLLLAHSAMAPDAVAAWLIPSEFCTVNYAEVIRRYLTERVSLVRIHNYSTSVQQFPGVMIDPSLVVFRNRPPDPRSTVNLTAGQSLLKPRSSLTVSSGELHDAGKWVVTHGSTSLVTHGSQRASSSTIGDLFVVRRGILTGANDFFVMSYDEARQWEIPARFLTPVVPAPRHLRTEVIEPDHEGIPVIEPRRALIMCSLPEDELRVRYPTLWCYFQTGEAKGLRSRYLLSRRNPWYRQEARDPSLFLMPYMRRRPFSFIWNQTQAVATNVYLMMYPNAGLTNVLESREDAAMLLHSFLNDLNVEEVRAAGRKYAGGLYKMEPRELTRLPIPPLPDAFADGYPGLG